MNRGTEKVIKNECSLLIEPQFKKNASKKWDTNLNWNESWDKSER